MGGQGWRLAGISAGVWAFLLIAIRLGMQRIRRRHVLEDQFAPALPCDMMVLLPLASLNDNWAPIF